MATETELRKRIPYRTLPRTFQDSIDIARTLRLPYIWIDAFCIIQEDPVNWEREATRMQQIYSGSTVKIAASGAKDTSAGFFTHETPQFRSASVPAKRTFFTFENSARDKTIIVQVQDRGGCHNGMALGRERDQRIPEDILSRIDISIDID
jgi:hypothetical protein